MPELTHLGECNMVELDWFGDLNGDEIADIIFEASSHHATYYTLLLSTGDTDKPHARAASTFLENCE
ncbi:MAG: hypothetical protein AAFO69_18935 [Bacteroidota bacterium]